MVANRTVWFWVVLIFLGLYGCSSEPEQGNDMTLPDPVNPENEAYIGGELIFPLDDRPTPHCHASTIEEIPDGLIAAWFGGSEEGNEDVGIWLAKYDGVHWSDPVEVAIGVQNDTLQYPCWNPVLFQPNDGPLMLFYKVGPSPREWWGELITSEDEGESWSEPMKLGTGKLGHLIGPVKNKPIQLENGTIFCPSSTERIVRGEIVWRVHFERTKDLGRTWDIVGPINDGLEFDAIQPSILAYPDGRFQVLCRTRQQVIGESWSHDRGDTWSELTATGLPNPNAGTDAVPLSDGRHLLVYNHTIREGGFPRSRNMLNIAISTDGDSWKPVMTLERQEGEYSYPAVIQAPDGLVHITYTYRRETIKHVEIDPEQLH